MKRKKMNHDPAINKLLRTIKNTKSGSHKETSKLHSNHHNVHDYHSHVQSAVEAFSSTSLSSLQSIRSHKELASSSKCGGSNKIKAQNHKVPAHQSLLKTHPLLSKEDRTDLSMFKTKKNKNDEEEEDEEDEAYKLGNDNNNNNKYKWNITANSYGKPCQKEITYFDEDICSSNSIKKKLHRYLML